MEFEVNNLITYLNQIIDFLIRFFLALLMLSNEICDAEKLICSYKRLDWKVFGSLYTCDVTSKVFAADNVITEVTDTNIINMASDDVRAFRVANIIWNYVPKYISNFFPNVLTLQISNAKLLSISSDDLAGLKKLVHINLMQNKLQSLDESTFEDLQSLKAIYLSSNQISFIFPETFARLPSLRILHVDQNRIHMLPGEIFEFNNNLEEINFNRNKINYIPCDTFNGLRNLQLVDFESNTCINFKADGTNQMPSLMERLKSCDVKCYSSERCESEIKTPRESSSDCRSSDGWNQTVFDYFYFRMFFGSWFFK